MSDFISFSKDLMPLEITILCVVFFYLLIVFRGIAEKLIAVAERQAKLAESQASYFMDRLSAVEKTVGISDKAFEFQQKQIKKLEEVAQKQEEELSLSLQVNNSAEAKLSAAEERLRILVQSLNLKSQEVAELTSALSYVELNSRAEALARHSHTVLTRVQGVIADAENLKYAQDLSLDQDEQQKICQRIISQASLLVLSLQNSLMVSSTEEADYSYSSCNLLSLIRKSLEVFESIARDSNITICIEAQDDYKEYAIQADQHKMYLAISNVIENAISYGSTGTIVRVSLKSAAPFLMIAISNKGIGISEVEAPKIFDLGYRGRLAYSAKPSGSGLGLYVANRVLTAHAGTISVTSTAYDRTGYVTVANQPF